MSRLDTVSKDTVLQNDYEYDLNSNRTSIDGGTTINATYDAQDRLETFTDASSTNWTFKYTDNGELERKYETGNQAATEVIYNYDVLGNLRGVDFQGTANDIEYIIDGRNRRVGKKVGGALVQQWLYKDQLNPIAELDSTGNVTKRFVYASRANIPDFMIIPSGVNAGTYRIVSDHLGSPRFVIDTAGGNTVQELDYDEWGNVLVDTNPGFTPFGFAGGLYDQDTKLVRFGARDYDPKTGRWTSKDPIRFAGKALNLFGYASNDPINLADLSGLLRFKVGGDEEFRRRVNNATNTLQNDPIGIDIVNDVGRKFGHDYEFSIIPTRGNTGISGNIIKINLSETGQEFNRENGEIFTYRVAGESNSANSCGNDESELAVTIGHELAHSIYGGNDKHQQIFEERDYPLQDSLGIPQTKQRRYIPNRHHRGF